MRWHDAPTRGARRRLDARRAWFPGGTLNYAEHALYPPVGVGKDDVAVIFAREDGLRAAADAGSSCGGSVAAVRAALVEHGVGVGDRVAALLPNAPEALIAMLATASLGAIWSSCSPDFGARAVADRFTQIEPAVLFAVDGYLYGGKRFDIRADGRAVAGRSCRPCAPPCWCPTSTTPRRCPTRCAGRTS